MVAWPQSLNLKRHHFSDFLPTKTLHCKDIKDKLVIGAVTLLLGEMSLNAFFFFFHVKEELT